MQTVEFDDLNVTGTEAATIGSSHSKRLGGWQRFDWLALGLLVALGTGLPLVVAIWSGSLGIPFNDDWAYRRIAETFLHTHHLISVGWGVLTLYGQILTIQPLLILTGNSGWAFGIYGSICGAASLISTYCLARRFLPTSRSVLVVFCVALAPGFLATETTYMTDVPALAATTVCLATGVAALDRTGRSRWMWLLLSIAVGIFGFSVRQAVIVAPFAVLVAALVGSPREWKPLCVLGIATGAACLGILKLTRGVPGHWEPTWSVEVDVAKLLGASVAFAVLPASIWVVATSRRAVVRLIPVLLVTGVVLLTVFEVNPRSPLLGDLVTQYGSAGPLIMIGSRPVLFPNALWTAIEWTAWASLACAMCVFISRPRRGSPSKTFSRIANVLGRPEGLMAIFVVGAAALLSVTAGYGAVWDRYCWPIVGPLAVLILLKDRSPRSLKKPAIHRFALPLVTVATVGLVLLQLALSSNADAFDAARWHAGIKLTRLGISARAIDAGFEWLAYHQSGPVDPGGPPGYTTYVWYEWFFAYPPLCGIASSSPATLPKFSLVGSTSYRLLAVGGPLEHVYLYKARNMRVCATVPG